MSESTEAARKDARQAIKTAAEAAKSSIQEVETATHKTAEFAATGTAAAADVAKQVLDHSEEAIKFGLRTIVEAQKPIADASYDRGRRALETASNVTSIYRQAAEQRTGDLRVLSEAYASLGRGLNQWHHAWFDLAHKNMERMRDRPAQFLRCRTLTDVAEVQREVFSDLIENTISATAALLQVASQIAQDAARPLRERSASSLLRA